MIWSTDNSPACKAKMVQSYSNGTLALRHAIRCGTTQSPLPRFQRTQPSREIFQDNRRDRSNQLPHLGLPSLYPERGEPRCHRHSKMGAKVTYRYIPGSFSMSRQLRGTCAESQYRTCQPTVSRCV